MAAVAASGPPIARNHPPPRRRSPAGREEGGCSARNQLIGIALPCGGPPGLRVPEVHYREACSRDRERRRPLIHAARKAPASLAPRPALVDAAPYRPPLESGYPGDPPGRRCSLDNTRRPPRRPRDHVLRLRYRRQLRRLADMVLRPGPALRAMPELRIRSQRAHRRLVPGHIALPPGESTH